MNEGRYYIYDMYKLSLIVAYAYLLALLLLVVVLLLLLVLMNVLI